MASKFFEAIRAVAHTSEFEAYYDRVQLSGVGGPTVDEAKRDYQALLGARASALTN